MTIAPTAPAGVCIKASGAANDSACIRMMTVTVCVAADTKSRDRRSGTNKRMRK